MFLTKGKTYLGDGLYAHDDGFQIVLSCNRDGDEHWVGLEPEVISALLLFIGKAYGQKITVKPAKDGSR